MIDSMQLGGAGKTVTLSFDISPEMLDLLASTVRGIGRPPVQRRQGGGDRRLRRLDEVGGDADAVPEASHAPDPCRDARSGTST